MQFFWELPIYFRAECILNNFYLKLLKSKISYGAQSNQETRFNCHHSFYIFLSIISAFSYSHFHCTFLTIFESIRHSYGTICVMIKLFHKKQSDYLLGTHSDIDCWFSGCSLMIVSLISFHTSMDASTSKFWLVSCYRAGLPIVNLCYLGTIPTFSGFSRYQAFEETLSKS